MHWEMVGAARYARVDRPLMDLVLHMLKRVSYPQLRWMHMRVADIRPSVFAGDSKRGVDVFAQFRRSIVTFWTTH